MDKAKIEFERACRKVRRTHKAVIKINLKILKCCFKGIMSIDYPKSNQENETLQKLISSYDECITRMNKDIDVYRKRIWEISSD